MYKVTYFEKRTLIGNYFKHTRYCKTLREAVAALRAAAQRTALFDCEEAAHFKLQNGTLTECVIVDSDPLLKRLQKEAGT